MKIKVNICIERNIEEVRRRTSCNHDHSRLTVGYDGCSRIEHSMDARNWQSIGFEDGQGSSVEVQAYSYCHEHPATGTNYYRLKQMDYDGAFEYSNIESVELKGKEDGLKIFPNPTSSGTFTLYIPNSSDKKTIIRLYDQAGSLVLEQSTFSALEVLDVQHLSAGVYFVETTVGSTVMREKVLVE